METSSSVVNYQERISNSHSHIHHSRSRFTSMSSSTELYSCSFFRMVFTSAIISIFIQIIWPILRDYGTPQRTFCKFDFVPEVIKRSQYCHLYLLSQRSTLMISTDVGYFIDPLSTEVLQSNDFFKYDLPPSFKTNLGQANRHLEAEAVAALHVATESRKNGDFRKAEVVIKHALALAPTHPDILTEYGMMLEMRRKNVVEAEGFYTRALSYNPNHAEALIQRARTLPVVEEIDNEMLTNLHRKRAYFLSIPRENSSLRRAMRESYFLHVYHTIAIEGNTMSLGQTRSILETRMAVAGKSIMEHNEILGMDAALRFINQSVVHMGYFTLNDILDIHSRVLGFVDPESAGVFRKTQVFVGSFTPVSADLVLSEMEELVQWLNDDDSKLMDPVERAAIAHYKLVYIHPFVDGNGRTARLLMNLILMQAGFPPVIIPVEARAEYYDALNAANLGDIRPFIRFIARQTDSTLQLYINAASTCHYQESDGACVISISQELTTNNGD